MTERLLHYDCMEVLGRGAGSVIYRARDTQTGRMVALKHVVRNSTKDIRFVEQMETEFDTAKLFNHPNLRRTFDLKISKSLLLKITEAFLIMELVEGKPLEKGLPVDMADILETFIKAAEGLRAMHKVGYAHCDIKPNNILRDDNGVVKVIDYGQACKIGTIKERIQGTPDYIAPEQVSRKPISEATDVFNLGATLYWALTGRHIPTAYTAKRKGENSFLIDSLFKSPMELNSDVPKVVSDLVMSSVSTRISQRPQDMEAVIRKLELGLHVLRRDNQAHPVTVERDTSVSRSGDIRSADGADEE